MCKIEQELQKAMKDACSLRTGSITWGLEFLGIKEETNGVKYRYYKDPATGEYFYTSDNIEKFDKEMRGNERRNICLKG